MKLVASLALALACGVAAAGPTDPSPFDKTPYKAQKTVYDFNFAKPTDARTAFAYIRNQLKALQEYGGVDKESSVVIVAHGNELHAFSRLNRDAFPGMYGELKSLADAGVKIRVCSNAARSRGYKPDEFYDVITVVPAAVTELAKLQNEGHSYMYAEWFPRLTRDDIKKQYPELVD